MTCWSHRPGVQDRPRLWLVWRVALGAIVATGTFSSSRVFSQDGPAVSPRDRGQTMEVRIPGTGTEADLDGVQAPPRPPVKEQAERKAWSPISAGPRRVSAGLRREAPVARPAPSDRVMPPSSLDAIPLPRTSGAENGVDRETRSPERPDNVQRTEEPREPTASIAQPMLRLSIDHAPSVEAPSGDERTRAPARLQVQVDSQTDSSASQGPEPGVAESTDQPPPLSLAERIEMLRGSRTPSEVPAVPEAGAAGVAEATDGQPAREASAPGMAMAEDSGVAPREEPQTAEPQPSPVELRLATNRPRAEPAGETIKMSIEPPGKAHAEGPAASDDSPSLAQAGSPGVTLKVSSSGAKPTGAAPAPSGTKQKPIHLSMKFPAPKSAAVPKSLRVVKPPPAGAGQPMSPGLAATGNRSDKEPVIVAKLGSGASSAGKASASDVPAADAQKATTADLKPIHLSIKGSTVTHQSVGETPTDKSSPASAEPETTPKTDDSPPQDSSKDSTKESTKDSTKGKSAEGGSGPSSPDPKAAVAKARLRQWSLLSGPRPSTLPVGHTEAQVMAQRSSAPLP